MTVEIEMVADLDLNRSLHPNLPQFLPQTDLKTPKPKSKDSLESLLKGLFQRWLRRGLNLRPWAYESPALPLSY